MSLGAGMGMGAGMAGVMAQAMQQATAPKEAPAERPSPGRSSSSCQPTDAGRSANAVRPARYPPGQRRDKREHVQQVVRQVGAKLKDMGG